MTPPDNPAGEYIANLTLTADERATCIERIAKLPTELRAALAGLSETEINTTVYKNWTIRQIVHHLGDSHGNGILRFKMALTGDSPRIFAYDPGRFVALADASELPVEVTLQLLEATHARWSHLLRSLAEADFVKGYFHPEQNRIVPLNEALGIYSWHGRHHTSQILWLREHRLKK